MMLIPRDLRSSYLLAAYSTSGGDFLFSTQFYQHVIKTPLTFFGNQQTSWREIYLKDETKQVTCAFKFRGNFHRLLRIPSAVRVVTTASTGNHGLGLSTSASILGFQAQVFVPATTSRVKLQALMEVGATISMVDGDYDHCKSASKSFAATTGASYIPSFDDSEIICGHSSLFYEMDNQCPQGFDAIFVPIGGGGLLAACIQHYQGKKVKIVGVELDSAPAMYLSLSRGKRVVLEQAVGRAEGLLVREIGEIPFKVAKHAQNFEVMLVSDLQIRRAIRLLWEHCDIRAEGAGAAALAAALHYSKAARDQKAVAIVSGGNIDEIYFQEALKS
jgi:threonine dehydratase